MTDGNDDNLDFELLDQEAAKQYVAYDADLSPFIKVIAKMTSGQIGRMKVTTELNTNKIKRRLSKAAEMLGRDIIIYTVKDPDIVVFKIYDPAGK